MNYFADYRYPLFWQGLESLFGADDDRRDIGRRLRERISIFLADNAPDQHELCAKVRACYKVRSEIVHGRWDHDTDIDLRMADTEAMVRTVVRDLLEKPGMLGAFISPQRDEFLKRWAGSTLLAPPPFP